MDKREKQIPAGRFKQHCLSIIDEVARTHRPVVISKRGRPMARLVPVETDQEIEHRILSRLRAGDGGMFVDEKALLQPSSDIAGRPGR